MPGDTYEIASMTVGETFSATMFVNSGSYSFSISIKPVGGSLISLTLTSPYTFSHTATMAATHYFRIGYTQHQPIDYRLAVTRAGITTNYSNNAISYNYLKKMQYFYLPACKKATMQSSDSALFNALNIFYPSQLPVSDIDVGCFTFTSAPNVSLILNESGIYALVFQSSYSETTYTI